MIYRVNESLADFKFWSGAADRVKLLTYSELEELDSIIQDMFGEQIPTETQINDLFWFDFETICQMLGTTEEEMFKREDEEQ